MLEHLSNWQTTGNGETISPGTNRFFNTEISFNQDIDEDGEIGSAQNDGAATYSISGTVAIGNTLEIKEDSPDPDGMGKYPDGSSTLSYSWQTSSDNSTWTEVGTLATYTVPDSDEGKSIKAIISYIDAQGYSESVSTSTSYIPIIVTVVESEASITLAKNRNGYAYAAVKGTTNYIPITDSEGVPHWR